jgi:hypothetical protein
MSGTQSMPMMTVRDDTQLLAWDLACASGALSEIATTWRRGWQEMPRLPLGLPVRLQDTARRLAADARSLAGTGPGRAPGQEVLLAGRLAALSADAAAARAVTCGPGSPGIGDALLWESLTAALRRAAARVRVTTRSAA